jgi:hypothetical protein
VHNNRFAKLIDSYRLATKVSPPTVISLSTISRIPAPSAHGGRSPAQSSCRAIADGAPISESTTVSNGPALTPNASGDAEAGPALNAPPMTFEVNGRQLRRDSNRG